MKQSGLTLGFLLMGAIALALLAGLFLGHMAAPSMPIQPQATAHR